MRTFRFLSFIQNILLRVFVQYFLYSRKVHWQKTCVILFLHSLFLLPKEFKGLTSWEFFWFSLLPLAKRFRGLTAWEFFWFFLFPLNKRFQRTNHLRYLLFPLTKIQGTNRLRILCLNTLERTSFMVQVECTSTWVVILRTREGTSLVDQFKWRVHPLGCSKITREGTTLVDFCL